MNIDETIGQAKEVAAQMAGNPARGPIMHHGLQIAVLDRGFIYIGLVSTDGEWVYIEQASNVRRWGTTSGLGQLALEGPTPDTRLDTVGTVKAPFHALQQLIDVEVDAWKNKL